MKKSKRKSENTSRQNFPKFMGHSKSSSKWEIYSNTGLPQEIRKISNKQPNFTHQGNRKSRTN